MIPNPVDTTVFAPRRKRQDRKPLRAIAVRGLSRQYGIDLAIRAFSGLEHVELTVVGSGPREQEYRALSRDLGARVVFLKPTFSAQDLANLYQEYDVFVAPSRTEAQGVAMCEAMATGMPVIAAAVGGIPEFVRDGVDGWLVPREDIGALRAAVQRFLDTPELLNSMGENARQNVIRLCEAERVADEELALLHRVAR